MIAAVAIALAAAAVWLATRACSPELEVAVARRGTEVPPPEPPAAAGASRTAVAERTEEPIAPAGASEPSPAPEPTRKPLRLHVIAAEDGRELEDAEVRALGGGRSIGRAAMPDLAGKRLLVRGASPLTVAPTSSEVDGVETIFVGAAGYVAIQSVLDWSSGGERTIALQRAASLELVVRGRPAATSATVTLRRIETLRSWVAAAIEREQWRAADPTEAGSAPELMRHESIATQIAYSFAAGPIDDPELRVALHGCPAHRIEKLSDGALTRIDGLEPGTWCVFVNKVDEERPMAVGVAPVALATSTRLELVWTEPAPPPLVPVAGRLLVDPLWFTESEPPQQFALRLRWRDDRPLPVIGSQYLAANIEATAIRDDEGVFAFDAGQLLPGSYLVDVREWCARLELAVPAGGVSDAILRLPPPADVDLALLDATDGSPIASAGVNHLSLLGVEGEFWFGHTDVEVGTDGHARFQAPVGPLVVRAEDDDLHAARLERFTVVPGRNEFTLKLARVAQLELLLKDGAANIAWDMDHQLVLERAGERHAPTSWSMSSTSSAVTFTLPYTGRWRASVRDVPCFEPSDPVDVDLVAGETTSIEIPLRPLRAGR